MEAAVSATCTEITEKINEVIALIAKELKNITGGNYAFEKDPKKIAKLIISHIDKKRKALNLKPAMHRPVVVKV